MDYKKNYKASITYHTDRNVFTVESFEDERKSVYEVYSDFRQAMMNYLKLLGEVQLIRNGDINETN